MYLVFTCMPDESYCRRLRSTSLLCLCYVFRAIIIFIVVIIVITTVYSEDLRISMAIGALLFPLGILIL